MKIIRWVAFKVKLIEACASYYTGLFVTPVRYGVSLGSVMENPIQKSSVSILHIFQIEGA